MATISTSGIAPGFIIEADQLLRVIYALNGVSGSDIIISGSLGVTGSFIVPAQVDASPATGSMYVEPANNRLWVFTGNSATGWVTASLGI